MTEYSLNSINSRLSLEKVPEAVSTVGADRFSVVIGSDRKYEDAIDSPRLGSPQAPEALHTSSEANSEQSRGPEVEEGCQHSRCPELCW